jgi:hypothetical protein
MARHSHLAIYDGIIPQELCRAVIADERIKLFFICEFGRSFVISRIGA